MTEGRLSDEELGSLVERLRVWANAADEGERISAAYVTGKIDAHQTSLMGDDLREAADELSTLQRSADEMRKALEPFSEFAGELFARNYNRSDRLISIGEANLHLSVGAFFDARAALSKANGADQ